MTDLATRLARFRTALRDSVDPEAASRVFHEIITADPRFERAGRPHDDARLRGLVASMLSRALEREVVLVEARLTRIDEARFIHGAARAVTCDRSHDELLLAITYFEADDIGLCLAFYGESGATFLRFAAYPAAGGAVGLA